MSTSLSFEVKDYDISQAYFQGTLEKTHLHLITACVDNNAELRNTNAAQCGGKQNEVPFLNPNQDVRKAMQGDSECLLDDDGLKNIEIQTQRRRERGRSN